MSLYLHEDITPEVIREAKKAGITGVKSYPAGVTTVCEISHQYHHPHDKTCRGKEHY